MSRNPYKIEHRIDPDVINNPMFKELGEWRTFKGYPTKERRDQALATLVEKSSRSISSAQYRAGGGTDENE